MRNRELDPGDRPRAPPVAQRQPEGAGSDETPPSPIQVELRPLSGIDELRRLVLAARYPEEPARRAETEGAARQADQDPQP